MSSPATRNGEAGSSTGSGAPALSLREVSRHFGGLRAVDQVTFDVRRGAIHGLIGPNGAGKTTVFNVISGLLAATAGRVLLDGQDITRLAPHARAVHGVARTFQTPQLFEDMSVLETVMTGRHARSRTGIFGAMFSLAGKRREESEVERAAAALVRRVGLAEQAHALARNLSYGQRRVLEIARALACEPRLILFDEVTAGLNPVETAAIAELIRAIVGGGVTVVLVEHDMRFVMGLCERITVLNFGRVLAEGTPAEIVADEEVVSAYLGRRHAA
jgi:branched-chain amino acid transport system ATP-binding protein